MSLSQEKTQEYLAGNSINKYHQQSNLKGLTLMPRSKNLIWNQLPKHASTTSANYVIEEVQAKDAAKTVFSTANIPQFEIPKVNKIVEHVDALVTLANANVSNAWTSTLNPWFWFIRAELHGEKGIIQTILPEEMKDRFVLLNNKLTDRQIMSSKYGVNSGTYATNVSITQSSSATYYIRIPTVLDGEYLENMERFKLKLFFDNIANVSSSSYNSDITVTDLKLRLTCIDVDTQTQARLRSENATTHDKRYLMPTLETTVATLSTAQTKIQLKSFNNYPNVAFAFVEVVDLSSYQYNRETTKALTSLDFTTQSGTVVDGITWTGAENLQVLAPNTFPDNSFFSQATYPYSYIIPGACLDGKLALESGVHTGGSVWENNMIIRLIAPSSYSNHTIVIRPYEYKHVRVQAGKLSIY